MNAKLKPYIMFLFLLSCLIEWLPAQRLDRKVFSTQGGNTTSGPYYFSFTLGEPVIGTDNLSLPILTKGFQQPIDPVLLAYIQQKQLSDENEISYEVYPNPARQRVNFRYISDSDNPKDVSIVNGLGQVFFNQRYDAQVLSRETSIDLSNIPVGAYWLICSDLGKKSIFPLRKE